MTVDEIYDKMIENDVTDQYDIGVIRKMIGIDDTSINISISEKSKIELFVTYTTIRQAVRGLPLMMNRTAVISKKVYNISMRDKKIKRLLKNE